MFLESGARMITNHVVNKGFTVVIIGLSILLHRRQLLL